MRLSPDEERAARAAHLNKAMTEFKRRETSLARLLKTARGGRPKKRKT